MHARKQHCPPLDVRTAFKAHNTFESVGRLGWQRLRAASHLLKLRDQLHKLGAFPATRLKASVCNAMQSANTLLLVLVPACSLVEVC